MPADRADLMREPRTAVYALTRQGLLLARELASSLGADLFAAASLRGEAEPESGEPVWFDGLAGQVRANFPLYTGHVFFAATGIVVRVIAPLLSGKDRDPAVVVADQKARHVISLLSGHLGGANALTRRVAAALGAEPVITTATDLEDLPSLDDLARERDLVVADPTGIKVVSAALLAGNTVALYDPENRLGLDAETTAACFTVLDAPFAPAPGPRAVVTERVPRPGAQDCLTLHPRTLCVGVGCRRGEPAAAILAAVKETLAAAELALLSVACLSSVEDKKDEPGLIEAARGLQVPLFTWPREVLAALPVTVRSAKAMEALGIPGVCEPAALAAAGSLGPEPPMSAPELIIPKTICHGVTVAVARARANAPETPCPL